jgi:hypothetical protein
MRRIRAKNVRRGDGAVWERVRLKLHTSSLISKGPWFDPESPHCFAPSIFFLNSFFITLAAHIHIITLLSHIRGDGAVWERVRLKRNFIITSKGPWFDPVSPHSRCSFRLISSLFSLFFFVSFLPPRSYHLVESYLPKPSLYRQIEMKSKEI